MYVDVGVSNSKAVAQYDSDGSLIAIYKSRLEAECQTGISHQHISHCICGKRKTAGGYIWKNIINTLQND